MPSKQEIERKWLMSTLPKGLILREFHVIHQAYLYADDNIEIRLHIRHDGDTYNTMMRHVNRRRLTIKFGNGLVREEAEIDLTEEQAARLIRHVKQPFIVKVFRIYDLHWGSDVLKFECSEVDPGTENSFIYTEIEFNDEHDARIYRFPDYLKDHLVREVTDDPYWQMKNYWRRTRLGQTV